MQYRPGDIQPVWSSAAGRSLRGLAPPLLICAVFQLCPPGEENAVYIGGGIVGLILLILLILWLTGNL